MKKITAKNHTPRKIIPQKQSLLQSCLVVCLLMLLEQKHNIRFSKRSEQQILFKGLQRKYRFYVAGQITEFFRKYQYKIKIVVDNLFFTKRLRQSIPQATATLEHEKITLSLIKDKLKKHPIICYLDDNVLGDYSHAPHFVILESAEKGKITYIDPMTGKRLKIAERTIFKGIQSLKQHIKMCPLLIWVE